jgi:hypothetical protein
MDRDYEVIDLKSGNVIGGFESEDAALASLRRTLETHGPTAIRDLPLMQITEDDQFVVAMQDDLKRLVRDAAQGMASSAP